jgi:hypothetical protein
MAFGAVCAGTRPEMPEIGSTAGIDHKRYAGMEELREGQVTHQKKAGAPPLDPALLHGLIAKAVGTICRGLSNWAE